MPLSLHTFDTVPEAIAALTAGGARYLGGGTLAVRDANEGNLSFDTLIRVADPALARIELSGGKVRLGASVTMAQVARHIGFGSVAQAALSVGGPAIRNMATVGGNLFAPTPYGDFAVALLALKATVEADGRLMDLDEFLLVRDEFKGIVSAVEFSLPASDTFRFAKVARVKPKGISVLSIAAVINRDGTGVVTSTRIALGCMNDRPIRAKRAEEALVGMTLSQEAITPAVDAVSHGIRPPSDPVASDWYRREVLPVHFRRLLLK
jgi:CO/xanthine dehydrogenase FAD-binding subunit